MGHAANSVVVVVATWPGRVGMGYVYRAYIYHVWLGPIYWNRKSWNGTFIWQAKPYNVQCSTIVVVHSVLNN